MLEVTHMASEVISHETREASLLGYVMYVHGSYVLHIFEFIRVVWMLVYEIMTR